MRISAAVSWNQVKEKFSNVRRFADDMSLYMSLLA